MWHRMRFRPDGGSSVRRSAHPPARCVALWAKLAMAAAVLGAWPGQAWADFCSGKQNGLWCSGSALVTCKSGAIAASQNCPSGCQSMPVGVNDQCKSASGPCTGKQNGAWCDADKLLQCKDGQVASSQNCAYGCQSMPVGTPDLCKPPPASSGPCAGKSDGAWCSGDQLLQCKGGQTAASQVCPNGCQQMPPGQPDTCQPAATPSPCTGKSDGAWCDGDKLLQCKGGQTSSSQLCSYGCQAMPPGTPDQCKGAPTPTGACSGKTDGSWCDGAKLLHCKGGSVSSSQTCSDGCQAMPAGIADQCKPPPAASGPCTGKADGAWCSGDALLVCKGGQSVGSQTCALGCQSNSSGEPDACKVPPYDPAKSCVGKADGTWCNGDTLMSCMAGKVASAFACPGGCQPMPSGVPDVCKSNGPTACTGKASGTWCAGADVVQCLGGQTVKAMSCAKGCAQPAPGGGACKVKSTGFCSGKADGAWCDGSVLTSCATGAPQGVFVCPNGCQGGTDSPGGACNVVGGGTSGDVQVQEGGGCATFSGSINLWSGKGLPVWNQKDFEQQLGTCPGLTIHNSGCTITSLSMLHAYLGLKRQVDGKEGNDPLTENAWRTQQSGYAATSYKLGNKDVSGSCLVIWGQAPGGLVPSKSHNDASSCITPKAAKFIKSALKAGMPIVAGVHWPGGSNASSENWHWVLIVGADDGGVLINDPWGGKGSVHLDQGGLGKYVLDDLYVFWYAGNQPGGMAPAPLDDAEPTTEDGLPKSLEYVDETPASVADGDGPDAGSATLDAGPGGDAEVSAVPATVKPGGAAQSGGCTAHPQGSPSLCWLAACVALWMWGKRRRSGNRATV